MTKFGTHMRIDLGWFLPKKLKWGVKVDILGGQKIKSPGNFMNCRENRYRKLPSGNFRRSKNQKSGKRHKLPRNVILKM